MTQVALIPVAYFRGTDFRPAKRLPGARPDPLEHLGRSALGPEMRGKNPGPFTPTNDGELARRDFNTGLAHGKEDLATPASVGDGKGLGSVVERIGRPGNVPHRQLVLLDEREHLRPLVNVIDPRAGQGELLEHGLLEDLDLDGSPRA